MTVDEHTLVRPLVGPKGRTQVAIFKRLHELRQDSPILVGWSEIEAYTGRSRKVLERERRAERLVMKKVDGKWVTTKDQCDTWLASFLDRSA
jgi:RecB family endonuclease NucS